MTYQLEESSGYYEDITEVLSLPKNIQKKFFGNSKTVRYKTLVEIANIHKTNIIKVHTADNILNNYIIKYSKNRQNNSLKELEKSFARGNIDCKNLSKILYYKADDELLDEKTNTTFTITISNYTNNGKNLKQLLLEENNFSKKEKAQIFVDVLNGLNELHKNGFIHNDIKSENIIYQATKDKKMNFVICDYDFIWKISKLAKNKSLGGTVGFYSPEKIAYSYGISTIDTNNPQTDIWSAGMVFFEVIAGIPLRKGLNKKITKYIGSLISEDEIQKCLNNIVKRYINDENEIFQDLFLSMLVIDPQKRKSSKECLSIAKKILKKIEMENSRSNNL